MEFGECGVWSVEFGVFEVWSVEFGVFGVWSVEFWSCRQIALKKALGARPYL